MKNGRRIMFLLLQEWVNFVCFLSCCKNNHKQQLFEFWWHGLRRGIAANKVLGYVLDRFLSWWLSTHRWPKRHITSSMRTSGSKHGDLRGLRTLHWKSPLNANLCVWPFIFFIISLLGVDCESSNLCETQELV